MQLGTKTILWICLGMVLSWIDPREGRAQLFFEQEQEVVPADISNIQQFGACVDIDGDTAIIGADFDSQGGANAGAAYVFVRNAGVWTQQQKIQPNDAGPSKFFGRSVDVEGNTAVIGAPGDVADRGSVYVFTRAGNVWTQQDKLLGSEVQANNQFGHSVALSGETLIAGANVGKLATGYATVFTRTGVLWSEEEVLHATDEDVGDVFGFAVDIDGDLAMIGAHQNDDLGHDSGSAYIFRRSGSNWTQEAKLLGSDQQIDDVLGFSVAIQGASAVVGAWENLELGQQAGKAYIFESTGSGWNETAVLLGSDQDDRDQFGRSVGIDSGTVVVGALRRSVSGFESGAAYIFEKSGNAWSEVQKIFPGDPQAGMDFGDWVAISGDTVIAGAPNFNASPLFGIGKAYTFTRTAAQIPQEPGTTPTDTPPPSSSVGDWGLYD